MLYETFGAGAAILEAGGCVEAPVVAPRIRDRKNLEGAVSPEAPEVLAAPREGFPLLVRPAIAGRPTIDDEQTIDAGPATLKDWARAARSLLEARLDESGAILLRGLPIHSPAEFSEFFLSLGYSPMNYVGAATRDEIAPGVFTTNTSKPDKTIMLHNEMAAERMIPAHLFLFCHVAPPPGAGGETPIARNIDWHEQLEPELRARIEARGLIRRFRVPSRGQTAKPGWQDRYGYEDPAELEADRSAAGDRVQWQADGSVVLSRPMNAHLEHRGDELWFGTLPNAHPVTSLEMCYADGELVEDEILQRARIAQWKIAVAFSWQSGDVLCLDNRRCQHGRLSFADDAERGVYVSIATPVRGALRGPSQ